MSTLYQLIVETVLSSWDYDCWLWEGYINDKGYGKVYSPVLKKPVRVHIVAYEIRYGKVPYSKELDHIVCDIRSCWNPDHVVSVFHEDNIQRAVSQGSYKNNGPKCTHWKKD